MSPRALLDTNVLVAALVEAHDHYKASYDLFGESAPKTFAVAVHSLAELYNTLTREGRGPSFGFKPRDAIQALERVFLHAHVVGLTTAQTFDGIRQYAHAGGVGPRLYDKLIGEAAVASGGRAIVTWNVRHMRGLFPNISVETPDRFH